MPRVELSMKVTSRYSSVLQVAGCLIRHLPRTARLDVLRESPSSGPWKSPRSRTLPGLLPRSNWAFRLAQRTWMPRRTSRGRSSTRQPPDADHHHDSDPVRDLYAHGRDRLHDGECYGGSDRNGWTVGQRRTHEYRFWNAVSGFNRHPNVNVSNVGNAAMTITNPFISLLLEGL